MAETYGKLCKVCKAGGDLDRAAEMQLKALQLKSAKLNEALQSEARAAGPRGKQWEAH